MRAFNNLNKLFSTPTKNPEHRENPESHTHTRAYPLDLSPFHMSLVLRSHTWAMIIMRLIYLHWVLNVPSILSLNKWQFHTAFSRIVVQGFSTVSIVHSFPNVALLFQVPRTWIFGHVLETVHAESEKKNNTRNPQRTAVKKWHRSSKYEFMDVDSDQTKDSVLATPHWSCFLCPLPRKWPRKFTFNIIAGKCEKCKENCFQFPAIESARKKKCWIRNEINLAEGHRERVLLKLCNLRRVSGSGRFSVNEAPPETVSLCLPVGGKLRTWLVSTVGKESANCHPFLLICHSLYSVHNNFISIFPFRPHFYLFFCSDCHCEHRND